MEPGQPVDRDAEILRTLQDIRDMVRELLVNQRMNILRDRASSNAKERAVQELIDELFGYIHQRRLLAQKSWWITGEAILQRDLMALLGKYQRRDVALSWGDVIGDLQTRPEEPSRDRAIEIAEYMVRHTGE